MSNNLWITQKPIAHRGLHNDVYPENSLSAYQHAINKGFPIEIDIRTIDDGTVIVFHDDALGRMTGVDGYASTLNKSDLNELRLNKSDEKIPTFEQVLELVNGKVPLLIETKSNSSKLGDLESKAVDILKTYNGKFAVQSFNPYSLEYFKQHAPDFLRGQLSAIFKKDSKLKYFERVFLSKLKLNKVSSPHFISYSGSDLPNKYVTKTNLPVLAWTIRNSDAHESVKPFCDQIIFENFIPTVN